MLASIAEREQTRTLLRAKVQKIIQKTAFGEDINTISVQNTVQWCEITKNFAPMQVYRFILYPISRNFVVISLFCCIVEKFLL